MIADQLAPLRTFAPGAWRHFLRHGYADRPLAERRHARQRADRVGLLDLRPEPGAAWFPLVAPASIADRDLLPGILASVRVGGPRPLPADARHRVVAWVTALVGQPAGRLADAPDLGFDHVPPGWTVNGGSWELAAALALLTHLLEQPVRQPLVVSAALAQTAPCGAIAPVRGLKAKRSILKNEAPAARVLLADALAQAPLNDWLHCGWRANLGMRLDVSPQRCARDMWSAWRRGDRPRAERLVPLAVASSDPRVHAVARWVRGSAALHRGDAAAGLADISQARRLLLEHRPQQQFQLEELDASLGIATLDRLDPVTACALLGAAFARLLAVPSDEHWERWRDVSLQVAGSYRRALVAIGDLDKARDVQRYCLDAACLDSERARCLLDLGDVCLRLGDESGAQQALDRAQAALVHTDGSARIMTGRFLAIQRVRAGLEPPPQDWLQAGGPRWRDFPQPLELAEAILSLGRNDAEHALTAWPSDGAPLNLYVASRLAALLRLRHPDLAWSRAVLQGLRPHVSDARMGPDARAALDGDGRAWAARVAY